jgi:transcriptional regulator with XRE-family HTH domain|tara:strand:+ start:6947 stop:7180 length:234 start_codon:yes stop_codon:yes gene_type:complete
MSYGYTTRLVSLNKQANRSSLGVKLGKVCIKQEIPVAEVASQLGVSRQTVYNWFIGTHEPHPDLNATIEELLDSYSE